MKKSILIYYAALTFLSLTACNVNTEKNVETALLQDSVRKELASNEPVVEKVEKRIFSDFIYEVGPRFNAIKKSDLDNARSFSDFIGDEHANRIVSYKTLRVIILDGNKKTDRREIGSGGDFTEAQLKLLKSSEVSTNLLIWADYREKSVETGQVEDNHWTPYLTIVPEKQAFYKNGKEALKQFLKNKSETARESVDPEKLKPAKLFFTVTQNGAIENIKLDRSSNYPLVDKKMIELIKTTQGLWEPAENSEGEKIDQELVVSFGLMGC